MYKHNSSIAGPLCSIISEISENTEQMEISEYRQAFILHFGEMGSRWGINRTVGQIYALLFVTEEPLNADQITQGLKMSRSNVSMGLKELQSWRLVKLQHLPGDRREYFSAPEDLWVIFRTLVDERRKRELDPTLSMLRGALIDNPTGAQDQYAANRMTEMRDFLDLITNWLDEVQQLDPQTLLRLMKLGRKVRKLIDVKQKITGSGTAVTDAPS